MLWLFSIFMRNAIEYRDEGHTQQETGEVFDIAASAMSKALERLKITRKKQNITRSKTLKEMQADHIRPWSKGGKTTSENCQVLCRDRNLKKSDQRAHRLDRWAVVNGEVASSEERFGH